MQRLEMTPGIRDLIHDVVLAHEAKPTEEYIDAVLTGVVVIRVEGAEYEGRIGRVVVGEDGGHPGLRFLSIPITVDDKFHMKYRLLFTPFTHNADAEIVNAVLKAQVLDLTFEFDFTRFGRYGKNLMALWAAVGGGLYRPLLSHTFLFDAYVFSMGLDPELLRGVGDGLRYLAALDDESLESLLPTFKTMFYKAVIRDMLCIRREQRRCPPQSTFKTEG